MSEINLDPQEIAKFARLSATWWDPAGESKPLHEINPLRLEYIQQHSRLEGAKVLDVGCGGGILSESLAKQGAEVVGIDMSQEVLTIARSHSVQDPQTADISYQLCTAEDMAAEHPGEFDVVTCMELLEHVPDPTSVIQACAKLVKPGGQVFFSTINRNPKAYLFAVVGAEYLLRLLPTGTHDYAKFIRPAELADWARQNHLMLQELKGITYNPLQRSYRLTSGISVNYMAYCRRET